MFNCGANNPNKPVAIRLYTDEVICGDGEASLCIYDYQPVNVNILFPIYPESAMNGLKRPLLRRQEKKLYLRQY